MEPSADQAVYEIRIDGHLDSRRTGQFEGMTIRQLPDGVTVLTGPVADQAALFGLLSRIRDLGVRLIAVQRRESRTGGHGRSDLIAGAEAPRSDHEYVIRTRK